MDNRNQIRFSWEDTNETPQDLESTTPLNWVGSTNEQEIPNQNWGEPTNEQETSSIPNWGEPTNEQETSSIPNWINPEENFTSSNINSPTDLKKLITELKNQTKILTQILQKLEKRVNITF